MKYLLLGVLSAVCAIAVVSMIRKKKPNHSDEKKGAPPAPSSVKNPTPDREIVESLPEILKNGIVRATGTLPTELTHDWLLDALVSEICLGDATQIQEYLDALISGARGGLKAAAKIGETIDKHRMEANKELPPGYIVKNIVYSGLARTVTGEVLLKAVVE